MISSLSRLRAFPTPYPEEELESAIARFCSREGLSAVRHVHQAVFGETLEVRQTAQPRRLAELGTALPPDYPLTARELAVGHTQLAYWAAMLQGRERDLVLEQTLTGAGVRASVFRPTRSLQADLVRVCRGCVADDRMAVGEAYLHRVHQIPEVVCCPAHGVRLVGVRRPGRSAWTLFVSPDELVESESVPVPVQLRPGHHQVADIVAAILGLPWGLSGGVAAKHRLREAAERLGLARSKSRVSSGAVAELVVQELGVDFLDYLRLPSAGARLRGWVSRAFWWSSTAHRVTHFVLLMAALGIRANDVSEPDFWVVRDSRPARVLGWSVAPDSSLRERHRQEILRFLKGHPGWSRSELCAGVPAAYAWVVKRDRVWYESVAPPRRPRRVDSSAVVRDRVDWGGRDRLVAAAVEQVAGEVLGSESRPERVTQSAVLRRFPDANALLGALQKGKLPLTAAVLERVVEDTTAFGVRKIRYVVGVMQQRGERVTAKAIKLHAFLKDLPCNPVWVAEVRRFVAYEPEKDCGQ